MSRKRLTKYISLNKPHKGFEAHHIDESHTIHIPKEIHWAIKHNLFHKKNMNTINTLAFLCLETEELLRGE